MNADLLKLLEHPLSSKESFSYGLIFLSLDQDANLITSQFPGYALTTPWA